MILNQSISPPRELTDVYGVSHDEIISSLIDLGNYKVAKRFANCDQFYGVSYCPGCDNYHAYKLHCKTKLCYQCGERRQAMIFNKIKPKLEAFKDSKDIKLLTLTLPPVDDQDYGEEIYKSWTSYFRRFRYNSFIKKRLRGGVYALETIKQSDGKGWYVHLHAMIETDYVPQKVVSGVWRSITKVGYIVDIRKVKAKGGYGEVTKYVTKPPRLNSGMDYARYIEVTESKRAFQTFGSFYNWDMNLKPDMERIKKCNYCGQGKTTYVDSVDYEEALDYLKDNKPVGLEKWC